MIFAPVFTAQSQHMAEKVKASQKLCGVTKKKVPHFLELRAEIELAGDQPYWSNADSISALNSQKCGSVFLKTLNLKVWTLYHFPFARLICYHTSYLSFSLHRQDFWRTKFTPKNA